MTNTRLAASIHYHMRGQVTLATGVCQINARREMAWFIVASLCNALDTVTGDENRCIKNRETPRRWGRDGCSSNPASYIRLYEPSV